jgi:hypothetical protein
MENEHIIDLDINAEESSRTEVYSVNPLLFVILYILSFGLYGVWWMYNAWRFFKEKDSLDVMPAMRAIFSIFFIYSLFESINSFLKSSDSELSSKAFSSGLMTAGFIILTFASRLPDPLWIVTFGASLCFMQPINAFNYALEKSSKYKPRGSAISGGQLAIIVIGGVIWMLALIGMFGLIE